MNPYISLAGAGLGAALLVISSHNPQHWADVAAPMVILPACIAFLGAAGLYRAVPPGGTQAAQQAVAEAEKLAVAATVAQPEKAP